MKRHALLVGVDRLNYDYYGENKDLCCSYTDTSKIRSFLVENKLFQLNQIDVRNSWQTHWVNILNDLNSLKRMANNTNEEFFIFLYFTGHGASIKINIDGEDVQKQFLCFYDRLIIEDVILEQLNDFGTNCRIFVMFDSCYSAGIIKDRLVKEDIKSHVKSLSEDFQLIYQLHKVTYDRVIKNYKDFIFDPKAEIFFLCACDENSTTEAGASCTDLSYFTKNFCEYWPDFNHNLDYIEFSKILDNSISSNNVYHSFFPKEGNAFFRNYISTNFLNIIT